MELVGRAVLNGRRGRSDHVPVIYSLDTPGRQILYRYALSLLYVTVSNHGRHFKRRNFARPRVWLDLGVFEWDRRSGIVLCRHRYIVLYARATLNRWHRADADYLRLSVDGPFPLDIRCLPLMYPRQNSQ